MHVTLNAEVARLIDARIARDVERRRVQAQGGELRRVQARAEQGGSRTPLAWLVARVTGRPPALPSPPRRA